MPERTAPTRTGRAKRVEPDQMSEDAPWGDRSLEGDGDGEVDVRQQSRAASRRETSEPREKPTPPARRTRQQQRTSSAPDETGQEEARGRDGVLPKIHRGWEQIDKARREAQSGVFFRWTDDGTEQVVKFLDVEPWMIQQHWMSRAGKQSFACIGEPECPMCKAGIEKKPKAIFQVLNLTMDEPAVQGLEVGPQLYDELKAEHNDKRHGPLSKMWWALSRTKLARQKGLAKWNHKFDPLSERDLEEEFQINVEWAEDVLDSVEPITEDKYFGRLDVGFLTEIVEEQYRS